MRSFFAVMLCCFMLFSIYIPCNALESQDKLTPAPEITLFEESRDKESLTVHIVHSLNEAEELRKLIYDIALQEYKTEEAFLASPEKYLAYETKLYLEMSRDGYNWETIKEITDTAFVLSLRDDILAFSDNSVVFLRVLLASENFKEQNTEKVYIYAPSEEISLYINEKTVIPCGIPLRFVTELSENMTLFIPQRTGYIFDGWSADGDKRISFIPEGTNEISLTAHFIPMTYEINYVLTTDITYPFGRADNTVNPISYTVGTGEKLYPIKSPVGGYTFEGWFTTPDFSGEKITKINPWETGDKLFYAKWVSDEEKEQQKLLAGQQYIKDNMIGDPDGDGKITAADARYVLRASVGLEEQNYEKLKRVDYFNTNTITAANARITLRVSVGLDSLYDILLENGILP